MTRTGYGCRLGVWLLALLVWVPAPSAHAQEDAGGRSVFAQGAGNRALALGGAYVAVADDPSAPLWNPAGLGLVQRKGFQFTHASLYGLEFSEQYASFALPSWSWGAASLSFRHFGVGGIEQRDDRNVLLSSDLSDSESELLIGYGKSVSPAWSIGGNVKLRRQTIAGYSASGLGLDLGVIVRPLRAFGSRSASGDRFRVGLAARNVVEPSLRLDEDEVSDPLTLQTGLAYSHPFGRQQNLLISFDLENSSNLDPILHAGLELRVASALAIRAGWDNDALTAGTSVAWKDFAFDYAYEDNLVESVHRFGVSIDFGMTTEQAHFASIQAEEQQLQDRLAQAFEARSKDQHDQLLNQARTDMAALKYDDAILVLGTLQVLDPEDGRAGSMMASCYREKGKIAETSGDLNAATLDYGRALSFDPDDLVAAEGLARVRGESDRQARRSNELRVLFDQGLDAFAAGEWDKARARFESVLTITPGDEEAKNMLRRVDASMVRERDVHLQRALRLINAGQINEAEVALGRARSLDPDAPQTLAVETKLAKARKQLAADEQARQRREAQAQRTPNQTKPVPPVMTVEKRREIEQLYRSGMEAMEAGKPGDAVRYWELVWSADPEYQRVSEYLKREYLTRGMEFFAAGKLEDAVREWESALRVDPSDARTLGYLERANEQLARIRQLAREGR